MSDKKTKSESSTIRFLKDFTAGTIAGWAQVLVGQPFDTVKVRLQTQAPGADAAYKGPMDCVRQIRAQEGLGGFYKGTLVPMLGVGACVSVQFAALSQAKKWFLGNDTTRPLGMGEVFAAGAFAGLANSVLSTPIEHIRIRLQLQRGTNEGPFKLVKNMSNQYGWTSAWKGWGITSCREVGYGAYFVTYEFLLKQVTPKGKTVNDISPFWLLCCGSLGGVAMWLATYPIDVVKSRIQGDHLDPTKAKYKGILDCTKKIWVHEGMYGFWKGFGPCMVRAFPVNAATFATYELVMRSMGGRDY